MTDITDFRRGRGDLIFSAFIAVLALFFLVFFFTQTGWEDRKLPQNMARYWMDQFGVTEPEGRTARLGRILKQGWVAPLICLCVLVPAALWNLRGAVRAHAWRQRFRQPTALTHERARPRPPTRAVCKSHPGAQRFCVHYVDQERENRF